MRMDECGNCGEPMYFSPVEINCVEYRAYYCIDCDGRDVESFRRGMKTYRLVINLKTNRMFPASAARDILLEKHRSAMRAQNIYFVQPGPPRRVGP